VGVPPKPKDGVVAVCPKPEVAPNGLEVLVLLPKPVLTVFAAGCPNGETEVDTPPVLPNAGVEVDPPKVSPDDDVVPPNPNPV